MSEDSEWGKDPRQREQKGQRPGGRHKPTDLKNSKQVSVVGQWGGMGRAVGSE